ncbi:MAG: hypothetical protein EB060_04215 [Proteobacteria bacterium]|nr:hypothetical protein [Pseudomonadota bacterium]
MRDETNHISLRFDAAKAAASFIHPRLSSVDKKIGVSLVSKEEVRQALFDAWETAKKNIEKSKLVVVTTP